MLQSVEGKTLHNLKENMSQTSVGVNKEQTIKMKDHIPRQTQREHARRLRKLRRKHWGMMYNDLKRMFSLITLPSRK